ncbi:hypothetical protein ACSBR1_043616 [Camellia fascicularis]
MLRCPKHQQSELGTFQTQLRAFVETSQDAHIRFVEQTRLQALAAGVPWHVLKQTRKQTCVYAIVENIFWLNQSLLVLSAENGHIPKKSNLEFWMEGRKYVR